MKKIVLLLITAASLTISSCNGDDDNNNVIPGLENSWSLINVRGGFSGTNQNFAKGKVLFSFKDEQTLIVANSDDTATPYMPIENGSHPYEITENPNASDYCKEYIRIGENSSSYCYSIDENNQLIMDNSYVDGFRYTFAKN